MMKEINCHIIQDILPLYVDEVVSDDTREMVEEHLKHCEECKKEVAFMKRELYLPVEKEVPMIKNLKRKWRNKKLMVSGLSVLLTGLILFGANYLVFHHDTLIPYSDSLVQIELQDDGRLASHYYGEGYYSVHAAGPLTVEIDGKEKRAVFLHYTKTISSSPTKKLFNGKDSRNEQDFIFSLASLDDIDVVYYADFDSMEIFDQGNNWEPVIEHAELLWEK